MAPTQEDIEQDDIRQRVRDQVQLIREPTREMPGGADAVVSDTEDDADHNYLFVPGVVLCDDADVGRVNDVLSAHSDELEVDSLGPLIESVVGDLGVYELMTPSTDFVDVRRFLAALDVLDEELGEGVVTPDHYLHVSATGSGRPCPATEPEETGLDHPWPKRSTRADADGQIKVTVSIIDTGFWNPAADPNGPSEWLAGAEAAVEGEETFGPAGAAARVRRPRHLHRRSGEEPGGQRPAPAPALPRPGRSRARVGHGAQPPARAAGDAGAARHQPVRGGPHAQRLPAEGLPPDLERDAQAPRGHRAGGRGRQRRHQRPVLPGRVRLGRRSRLLGQRRGHLELLQLRQLR